MSRRTDTVEEVDLSSETDEAAVPTEGETPAKTQKAKKEPARGVLPEGFVTPIGLAKELTTRELHTDKNGGHEVRPQMVYSYKKNAPKDDPFPIQTIQDSLGKDREVVSLEEGIAWWTRKNERVAGKRQSAEQKRTAKAERAAAKAAEPSSEAEGEVAAEAE